MKFSAIFLVMDVGFVTIQTSRPWGFSSVVSREVSMGRVVWISVVPGLPVCSCLGSTVRELEGIRVDAIRWDCIAR